LGGELHLHEMRERSVQRSRGQMARIQGAQPAEPRARFPPRLDQRGPRVRRSCPARPPTRRAHRASPRMWTFLTGSVETVRHTVVRGLRVDMGGDAKRPEEKDISHGTHLVLVDGEGRIRGYYDSDGADVVEARRARRCPAGEPRMNAGDPSGARLLSGSYFSIGPPRPADHVGLLLGRASHLHLGLGVPADHHPESAGPTGSYPSAASPPSAIDSMCPEWQTSRMGVPGDRQLLQARRAEEHVQRNVEARPGTWALLEVLRLTDVDHAVLGLPGLHSLPHLRGGNHPGHPLRPQEEVGEDLAGPRRHLAERPAAGRGGPLREGTERQAQRSPGRWRACACATPPVDQAKRMSWGRSEALATVVHQGGPGEAPSRLASSAKVMNGIVAERRG